MVESNFVGRLVLAKRLLRLTSARSDSAALTVSAHDQWTNFGHTNSQWLFCSLSSGKDQVCDLTGFVQAHVRQKNVRYEQRNKSTPVVAQFPEKPMRLRRTPTWLETASIEHGLW
jgi:hypothetical protein